MSWDSYIDNGIEYSAGNMDKMCIIGLDGSFWTTSNHPNALKISTIEATNIANVMNTGDMSSFQRVGITIEDITYQFLRGEDGIALGKRKGHGAITIEKSNTAVVIGHTIEGKGQGRSNTAVTAIAEYLKGIGM